MTEGKKGKWLVATNTQVGAISFKHPDPEASDEAHLRLAGFESKVVDLLWLEVPHFVGAVESKRVTVDWTDKLPSNDFVQGKVVEQLVADGFTNNAAATIYQICSFDGDELPEHLDQYIDLAPGRDGRRIGRTYIGPRWDLVEDHLPFLQGVLALEQRWRNRPGLVRRIENRIVEIREST